MIEIGQFNTLPVLRFRGRQVLLGTHSEYLELPVEEAETRLKVGERLRVFVYTTSEGPVATLREPLATVGQFAFLEVVDVTEHGAFLDWGLPKDLFVPHVNQHEPMRVGQSYVVGLRLHERTQRVVGSSVLMGMFDDDVSALRPAQEVDLLVYGQTDRGVQVIVKGRHAGMIYHDLVYQTLRPGDRLQGWIAWVREDHRLDITLQRPGRGGVKDARARILEALQDAGGELALHDRSSPDEIGRQLQMSKKVFKKAIGTLYKQRVIAITPDGIRKLD